MDTESFRQYLADYIAGQSEFRGRKAEEYPDDTRNIASARALRELRDFVLKTAEPSLLDDLGAWVFAINGTDFLADEEGARALARYGFSRHGLDNPPAVFLRALVESATRRLRIRENRARRLAARQGYRLMKSRCRNPCAYDFGGWMIVDVGANFVVAGGHPVAFGLDLELVEELLAQ